MLERLPIPVLLIGAGGRIERANPAARTFLGLGTERGLLSTVLRQPRVLEAVSAALRGDRGATVEYSTLAPLESHVRAYVEPIRLSAPGPMPFRAMLVLADDTNSKRAERMRADFLANASHEHRHSHTVVQHHIFVASSIEKIFFVSFDFFNSLYLFEILFILLFLYLNTH